jgi:hypothetical protein
MTKAEWNIFFGWLTALFPQWRPDVAISAVWFSEIGMHSRMVLIDAVRAINTRKPSPFPPGVFEIKAEINQLGIGNVELMASQAWQVARSLASGRLTEGEVDEMDSAALRAIRLVGGVEAIGLCHETQRPFLEKRFLEIYRMLRIDDTVRRESLSLNQADGQAKLANLVPKLLEEKRNAKR